jgi:hypothetical protein
MNITKYLLANLYTTLTVSTIRGLVLMSRALFHHGLPVFKLDPNVLVISHVAIYVAILSGFYYFMTRRECHVENHSFTTYTR